MSTLRIGRIATDAEAAATRVRVARLTVEGTAAISIFPLADMPDVEPAQNMEITAVPVGTITDPVWSWRKISGPTIGLTAIGATVLFDTPADINGASIVLGVKVSAGGQTSVEQTFTMTIMPQTDWWWTGTGWSPRTAVFQ